MKGMEVETGHRRRWVAIALLVGAPLLAVALILSNLLNAADLDERAQARALVLQQLERRLAAAGGADVDAPLGDTAPIYLAASSGALARAELQQRVVKLVESASGRLIEARDDEDGATPSGTGEDRSVLLRVTVNVANDGLFDFLHAVETGVPLLRVEEIGVRKLPGRTGAGLPGGVDESLRVSLAIRGYWTGADR